MKKDENKPENPFAFPSEIKETVDETVYTGYNEGMTLRDYFAAKAMHSLIDKQGYKALVNSDEGFKREAQNFARLSYAFSDAMLKQREL